MLDEPVSGCAAFHSYGYLLFYDEQRKRRTPAEAKERCDRSKNNPDFGAIRHLARLQAPSQIRRIAYSYFAVRNLVVDYA